MNNFGFLITDGEVNIVKIYTGINKEIDSIEMLLNQEELRKMVNSLAKFEDEVNQFKTKNKVARRKVNNTKPATVIL